LQFSDRQRQIFDKGDMGSQILILLFDSPKWEISSPKFCTFERKFFDKNIFRQAKAGETVAPILPCHDATDLVTRKVKHLISGNVFFHVTATI